MHIFAIVLVTLFAGYFAGKILQLLEHRMERTNNPWDDAFFRALHRPVRFMIWLFGLSMAINIGFADYPETLTAYIPIFRRLIFIVGLGWFGVRFMERAEINLIQYHSAGSITIDQMTIRAVTRLLKIAILITAALIAMQTMGFNVTGVVAFGGIGGVAVGFAAKDLLANFFGALMIYFDRPFNVGDWVRSPDREIEGTVEDIGWRLTIIRTFDKRPLYVPNSAFSNISVENPSRMTNRRIYETIGVRYDDISKVHAITTEVDEMLRARKDIDKRQTLMVYFNKFNASSLDFFIYCFTKTVKWDVFHSVKHDVLLEVSNIIAKHGAEIAYPTQTLHMASAPPAEKPVDETKSHGTPLSDDERKDVEQKTHTINQPF